MTGSLRAIHERVFGRVRHEPTTVNTARSLYDLMIGNCGHEALTGLFREAGGGCRGGRPAAGHEAGGTTGPLAAKRARRPNRRFEGEWCVEQ